jgi:hypothetical protein
MIYHIPYYYVSCKEDELYRNSKAFETWLEQYKNGLIPKYSFITQYNFTSKDIGDGRILPFVNDIIENGIKFLNEDDVVILTNLDICFKENFLTEIQLYMQTHECGYAPRIEVPNDKNLIIKKINSYPDAKYGSDVFFFKVNWWKRVKKFFPKYFIGCGSWDMILIVFMNICEGRAIYKINYHREHNSPWKSENVANEFNNKNYYELAIALFDFFNTDGNPKEDRFSWLKQQASKYYTLNEEFYKKTNETKELIIRNIKVDK